jgi:uncharacterized membrane protein
MKPAERRIIAFILSATLIFPIVHQLEYSLWAWMYVLPLGGLFGMSIQDPNEK